MPILGPAPKDPRQRARRNGDIAPVRYVENRAVPQPELSELVGAHNPLTQKPWSTATIGYWRALATFPSTSELQLAQWHTLARAMMLDDLGQVPDKERCLAESRMQISKFGVTPDDLAKLRIFFADAAEKEAKGEARKARSDQPDAKARYGGLRAVND